MKQPHGIYVFGASGSGTTTLGRALAERLGCCHLDCDDFFWEPSGVPFTVKRPREQRQALLLEAIEKAGRFVLSGSMAGWDEPFRMFLDLAVYVRTPAETRIRRLAAREQERFGSRIEPGGDMAENHADFLRWAAAYDDGGLEMRSRALHEAWIQEAPCGVLRADGSEPPDELADRIAGHYCSLPGFAEAELQLMGYEAGESALIRTKAGISVRRVNLAGQKAVLKSLAKAEDRREIDNYRLLKRLGIPTLDVYGSTERSILMEDIEAGKWRPGTASDLNDPQTARLIAAWYRCLHDRGREEAGRLKLYDETGCITAENLSLAKERTGTASFPVWDLIEARLTDIQSAILRLPRTLVYNDFYWTNLAVARDGSAALMFDYNLLGRGYVYGDLRNVLSSLSEEAGAAFLEAYGEHDPQEVIVDRVASPLVGLILASRREVFPDWGEEEAEKVRNGKLQKAAEELLAARGW